MSDALADNRRFRSPRVIDDFNRAYLATVVGYVDLPHPRPSRPGSPKRAAPPPAWRSATPAANWRRTPYSNGTKIAAEAGKTPRPGKPMQNGLVEGFNGRLRDEGRNDRMFLTRRHARRLNAVWRDDFDRTSTA